MVFSTNSLRSNRLPPWLRRRIPRLDECSRIESVVRRHNLKTVCREALCPNRAECWGKGKATFIILGNACTRGCGFCSVPKGTPAPPDSEEPHNLADAVRELRLEHVIVTSVTRDDLPDGGSGHFAAVIGALKSLEPEPLVEVLVPDFRGSVAALEIVLEAGPDIFSHNLETVERLYGVLRKGADYLRSLFLLSEAKNIQKEVMTKSSLILGLGEEPEEVERAMRDLRAAGCDFLAVGQYLRPGIEQVPVSAYISPGRFSRLEVRAYEMGFLDVAAGPLVRSSYQENHLKVYQRGLSTE